MPFKQKNKRATVLILKDRMKNLSITYKNLADIIYLDKFLMDVLMKYFYFTGEYECDNYIYGHFHKVWGGNYIYDDNLNFVDRYKKNVFEIPLDTPLMTPIIAAVTDENISNLYQKYILNKERTIILCPYANSLQNLDINFWIFLAKIMRDKNYIVYTNVAENEKPVEGTLPINTNFAELNFLADKINCFIGLRSGIFDFLAMTKAKLLYIRPFPGWADNLQLIYNNSNSVAFFDAIRCLFPIINKFQNDNVRCQLKLSHEHIDDKNIYYSYEDILRAIVAEVEKI